MVPFVKILACGLGPLNTVLWPSNHRYPFTAIGCILTHVPSTRATDLFLYTNVRVVDEIFIIDHYKVQL